MRKLRLSALGLILFSINLCAQMWSPENPIGTAAIIGGKDSIEKSIGDIALKDKLLGMQFSVDYYDDTDVEGGVVPREDVQNHDFIVASESASSSRLRQLRRWEFSTPTINMEPASVQNNHHKLELIYAVATGNGWMLKTDENATKIKILDGAHPLSAGYSTGDVLEVITDHEQYLADFPFAEGIIGYMVDDIGVIPIASFNTANGDTALVICGIEVGTVQVDTIAFQARYVQFNVHSNTVPTWTEATDSLFKAAINWVLAPPTNVDAKNEIIKPAEFTLRSNYPNPFNPSTLIEFDLRNTQDIELEIYNIAGKKVRSLISAELAGGKHSVIWDGTDQRGELLPSGIYYYSLSSNYGKDVKKMTLLK